MTFVSYKLILFSYHRCIRPT